MKFVPLFIMMFFLGAVSTFAVTDEMNTNPNDPKQDLLDKAQMHFDEGDEEAALQIYMSVLTKNPTHYHALWRSSLIYTRKARRQTSYESQLEYYKVAREFAQLTLDSHPDKPRSHYVYGIASAGMADDMPTSSERIKLIWEMKEYGERALKMDPAYAPAWHLMGIWNSNIAKITRAERIAAKLIYGTLPSGATNEKAEEYLKKAIQLDPSVILFRLDLAQHYQENGQRKKALPVLESILSMEPVSANDRIDMEEARERYDQLR